MSSLPSNLNSFTDATKERTQNGLDRFDEVWDGKYFMSPMASNEHQDLASEITTVLRTLIDWSQKGQTFAGANVSDRESDWTQNYRVPNVLVYLNETKAKNCGSHWWGGPDFAVEIVSPGDRTMKKLDFYGQVGTRELLIIDRDPWRLTLYQLDENSNLSPISLTNRLQPFEIESEIVPLVFSLNFSDKCLELSHLDGKLIRSLPIQLK